MTRELLRVKWLLFGVARAAAWALGRMGPGAIDALDGLTRVVADRRLKSDLREDAARALESIADDPRAFMSRFADGLIKLSDSPRFLRPAVLKAIMESSEAALPSLLQLLSDSAPNIRAFAA